MSWISIGDKSLDDTEESKDVYSWIMMGKEAGVLVGSPRYPSCSTEPAQEDRAPSDTSWSVVGLAHPICPSCSVSPVSLFIDSAGELS